MMHGVKLLAVCLLSIFFQSQGAEERNEKQLLQHLFSNYSANVPPVKNRSHCIDVAFSMKLMQILEVDEKNQKIKSQSYFGMRWVNELLKWNPKEWNGINKIAVDPQDVWLPDIILKNNADSDAVTIQKDTDKVWIKHDGRNSWYPKVMMISSFRCDVTYFPFDNQNILFHFGSWSLGEKQLRVVKDESPMLAKNYLEHAEWNLVHTSKDIIRTPSYSDAYIEICFTYFVSRKPMYSVITAIVPSIGLMSIALFSYLLPPNHSERITILITTLLAFTVFLVEINQSLPRNSDSVPIIQVFYMTTVLECMFSFFLTCFLVRVLERKGKDTFPIKVPFWIQRYFFNVPIPEGNNISVLNNHSESKVCYLMDHPADLPTPNHTARRLSSVSVDIPANENIKVISEPSSSEITWEVFILWVDACSLRIFTILFLATLTGTFLPLALRYHHT